MIAPTLCILASGTLFPATAFPAAPQSDGDAPTITVESMEGMWASETIFGPEIDGILVLREHDEVWHAEIEGRSAVVQQQDDVWAFELPGERGSFRGQLVGDTLRGFWFQPRGRVLRDRFATPAELRQAPDRSWRGRVDPHPEQISLYFEFELAGGKLNARMRNPERNIGVFYDLGNAVVEGRDLLLYNAGGDEVLLRGQIAASGDRWSLDLEQGGATVEFSKRTRDSITGYFPADSSPEPYAYRLPLADDDQWPIARPAEVGLKPAPLEALVQSVLDTRYESRSTPYIHSLQVARHGKLVLDEYFHGFHRDRPHDTRSSCKTLTAMLTGIAMDNGAPFDTQTPVLGIFADEVDIQHVDDRKRALTVEHLLTMRSGFHCDDNVWDTPGNEDRMQSQTDQPDWVRYTLDLPMAREPGESAIYCTAGINLLGAVIERTTGSTTLAFFDEAYARPLGIHRYHVNLDPLDRGYMGGGMRLRPRDHMKLGQLLVDKGKWRGQQVVSSQWVERMTAAHASIHAADDYGFGTWRKTLQYEGVDYPVVYASGNGGQFVIAIPSVGVVVLIAAGNYMDFRTWIAYLDDLVPKFVLASIGE